MGSELATACSSQAVTNRSLEFGSLIGKHRVCGFTLLEVVVVLAITGLLFGFAVLAIGDGGRSQVLEQEGKRLKALFELAAQMAVLQSQEIGVAFSENTYGFLSYQEERWQPLQGDSVLRERSLPEGFQIRVVAEGRLLPPEGQENGVVEPQVIFFSNGEILPFEIHLADEHVAQSLQVTASLTGTIELREMP